MARARSTLDDVMAVVADASELKLDPIVDGAFAGKPDLVESEFAKAMVAGTYPGVIISAAQRQAAWLHKSALAVAEGTPVSTLLESGFPRLHFSRKANVEIALRNFSAARLVAIIDQLATAALDMRKQASLAAAIAQRTLLVDRGESPSGGDDDGDQSRDVYPRSRSMRGRRDLTTRLQPPHHFVELFEIAVADLHAAAGIAVVDADGKPERVADAFLQRDRVGILHLAAARAFCGLRSGTPSTCASASA